MLPIAQPRSALARTRNAIAANRLSVGFLGGSITDARPGHNWPEPVLAWLLARYPSLRLTVENQAIGATGSELACFRVDRTILDRGCDLVFVEYAVNDSEEPSPRRARTREGLIRKLLGAKNPPDVVLVYTFRQSFYADMIAGKVPPSIAEFERLADHYRLPSVWMSLHALREVQAGLMRWDEFLPDNLHPTNRGSLSYASAVNAFLESALSTSLPPRPAMPAPLDPLHWQTAMSIPFADVKTAGPWTIRRFVNTGFLDSILATTAPGATMEFSFTGRSCTLGFDFGQFSSEFIYRIDDRPAVTAQRDRPAWVGNAGWLRFFPLFDDDAARPHRVQIEVTHPMLDQTRGTNFHLAFIGVVP